LNVNDGSIAPGPPVIWDESYWLCWTYAEQGGVSWLLIWRGWKGVTLGSAELCIA